MLISEKLKKSILQAAIQGKLTEQLPADGSAKTLLAKIKAEKQKLIAEGKIKKEKPLAPITDDEKPFEIPENWEWVRWGTIAISIQYGYNAPALVNGRIKLVRISDIQNGEILWDRVPYCNIDEDEIINYMLEKYDILFARTGGTVGKSYLVQEVPIDAIYAGYLIRTKYNYCELSPQYLKFFMESSLYWEQLRLGTVATAQPNCNGQTLAKMLLPLPPLSEQKRIVARVEKLFAEIEKLEKDERKLDDLQKTFPSKLKNSLLQAAMQGKLTEQLPSDGNAKRLPAKIMAEKMRFSKEHGIRKVDFVSVKDDCELPEIPENWCFTKAGNIFTLWDGKKVADVKLPNLDARFLRSYSNATYISKGKFVPANQTMILVDGENSGEIFIPKVDGIQGSTFKLLEISKAINYDFAMYFLEFYREYLRNNKKGAAIPHLNKDEFKNLIFPIPPLAEQKRIVEKLEELLPLCEDLAE